MSENVKIQPATPLWDAMFASVQGGMYPGGDDGVTYEEDYLAKSTKLGEKLERDRARLLSAMRSMLDAAYCVTNDEADITGLSLERSQARALLIELDSK